MKINNRIARFYKVSFEQFLKDWCDTFEITTIDNTVVKETRKVWDNIKIPTRATKGSAGYDFHSTFNFVLEPNMTVKVPTGIRCEMDEDWVLKLYPRSNQGFKFRLQLNNTVGIIDSDYFYSDNEGHIFIKITNDSNEKKTLVITEGDAFVQGVFVPYGITVDDKADGIRNGGFGSTSK